MKKTESFTFSKHIFLDNNRMSQLLEMLNKHCERLSIQATTVDHADIEFDSYDELLQYENSRKRRIKKLQISGFSHVPWDKNFALTFFAGHQGSNSLECVGYFNEKDEETLFYNDIKEFVEKATYAHIPAVIGHYVSIFLIYALAFILLCNIYQNPPLIAYFVASIIATIMSETFLYLIWDKLFPIVSFSWGEVTKYYSSLHKVREWLFGSVIAAAVIGLLVNYISHKLFNS